MKKKSWFEIKKYPHIGIPPKYKDCGSLVNYIKDPEKVRRHGFYPFLFKEIATRKFRREIFPDGSRSKLRKEDLKIRNIYYANNIDSNIYSYYSHLLQKKYECKLKELNIRNIPTAYRSIPLIEGEKGCRSKCNIDFAEEAFNFIRDNDKNKLACIALDITSFFDNLDHSIIKKKWIKLLGNNLKTLPPDHYNVFKNITKFSYIEEKELFREFKNELIVEEKDGSRAKKKVDRISYMKGKNVIAFCEATAIKSLRSKNYIKSNKLDKEGKKRIKGIPQGSPISALLANLYMIDFDRIVNDYVSRIGGFYRRYSDDLVVVVPAKYEKKAISLLVKEIETIKLEIKPSKTQVFWFLKLASRYYCFEKNQSTNQFQNNTKFDYLGFSFDGKNTFLKSASLSNYYRKMKKSVRRGFFFLEKTSNDDAKGQLFKRRLYKRFTHLGAQRRRKYTRHPTKSNSWVETKHYDWGNYLSYASMAARIMRNNKIKGQLSKHWNNFHELIK